MFEETVALRFKREGLLATPAAIAEPHDEDAGPIVSHIDPGEPKGAVP